MNFVTFIIFCVVCLLGYYIYLILAPDKKGTSFDNLEPDYPPTEIAIEPPIKVSMSMVTFLPSVMSLSDNSSPISANDTSAYGNRYNKSNINQLATSDNEVFIAFTPNDVALGRTFFSSITI